MTPYARFTGVARTILRATLFLAVAAWMVNLPSRLDLALYNEQYLALVLGLATADVLLGDETTTPKPWLRVGTVALAAVVLALLCYVAWAYPTLQLALVSAPPEAVVMGLALILGVLEATRRRTGPFLPILLFIMFGFAFVGPHLPDVFQTRPVGFSRLVVYLGLDTNALFGTILYIASVVVIPFIVFGFLLNSFGGSLFFSGLATRLVGQFKGGPAKVSVVGSGAFGMVSGSAVANVVAVGSVSIPMMNRAGYPKHVAAAIEAVSSTGGQLMPPIMGASAFLMAEILEIPYQDVVLAAILPSLFFYVALMLAVDFEARRLDIRTTEEESLALAGGDRRIRGWRFLIPVGVLLYYLFVERRTPEFAATLSIAALIAVFLAFPPRDVVPRVRALFASLPKDDPAGWLRGVLAALPLRRFLKRVALLARAVLDAMGAIGDIIMLAATAGLIIGILNITGISFAITLQIVALSGESLSILLLLTAVMSIILGLGMPTVGVYVLLATLVAPALVELGTDPLAAHFYVLYFGMLSMITPPIAVGSFAAASVAGTSPWRTSFASLRVGAGIYLVPIAFVLQPELLMIGDPGDAAVAALRLLAGVALITAVFTGHIMRTMPMAARVLAAPLAFANILPFRGGNEGMVPGVVEDGEFVLFSAGGDSLLWIAFVASVLLLVWYWRPRVAGQRRAAEEGAA